MTTNTDPITKLHTAYNLYYSAKLRIRKAFRLSSTAADVLLMMHTTPLSSPARIAERLGMTHPNTMRMLRNLEHRHLLRITPHPTLPGRLRVSLTKRGKDAVNPNL